MIDSRHLIESHVFLYDAYASTLRPSKPQPQLSTLMPLASILQQYTQTLRMRADATKAIGHTEMSPIVLSTETKTQIPRPLVQRPLVQRTRRKVDVFGDTAWNLYHCHLDVAYPSLKNQGCLPSYLSAGNRKGTSTVPSNTVMGGISFHLRP